MHGEACDDLVFALADHAAAQDYAALFGKFDGVAQEIDQDLADPHRVAMQHRRQGGDVGNDFEALDLRPLGDQAASVADQAVHLEIAQFQLHLAGFDLREVEDVVDDAEQVLGGAADLVELFGLRPVGGTAAQDVGEADDGIHRRANFMAHVGQEGTLGLIGFFGGIACLGDFPGAGGNQFLQVIAVARQFFVGCLALGDVEADA